MQLVVKNRFQLSFQTQVRNLILLCCVCLSFFSNAQETLSELLNTYNTKSVPYISVEELAAPSNEKVILLDSRELKEYRTSHLKNATCIGYDNFQLDSITKKLPNKDSKIVVYCSLGIRSEIIAEKLKKAGYKNVFNLYGGIFEWKNKNFKVYDTEEKETENVHTFNKEWSKWLTKGVKVYEKKKTKKKKAKKKTR